LGFCYTSGRHGTGNWAVEHNVGMFSALPLLYACGKGHAVASTMNNSANLMSSC